MDLYGKRGFVLHGMWFGNFGHGHEKTAVQIIEDRGWNSEWEKSKECAQDFIVLHKGAIQLGSSIYFKKIIVSAALYNAGKIDKIKRHYHLRDYEVVYIS